MTPARPAAAAAAPPVDEAAARGLAALLAAPAGWLHRRSEHLRFHDAVAVSRRAVVDLTVPPSAPRDDAGSWLVPVALLPKAPLARFAVTDEEDRPLPVLTTAEQQALARAAVRVMAAEVLGGPLPAPLAADLDAVVTATGDGARHLDRLWRRPADTALRARLRAADGGAFGALVGAMATGFLVVVALAGEVGARRVVTVRRDERITHRRPAGRANRLLRAAGWRPATTVFPVSAALAGRSAHVEVAVPAGVDVARAVAVRGGTAAGGAGDEVTIAEAGDAPHVHLHLGALAPGDRVEVRVDLRPEPHGWIAQSAWAATGVAAALVGAGWRLEVLTGPDGRASAEAASLLLGLTGLAATLLVRPREHPLATRLLAGLRWLAALPPVAAAAVAGMLVVGPGRPLLDVIWWTLAGGCLTVAVVLQVARRPRRGG